VIKQFRAKACAIEEDEDLNSFMIVLADDPENPEEWIELQQALEYDEQDQELGMDSYCIVDESGASYYGGISECKLDQKVLGFALNEEAGATLGFDSLVIELAFAEPSKEALCEALQTIFERSSSTPQTIVFSLG
jgi:hypothetical protein